MSEIVAKRYAKALLDIAMEHQTVDAFEEQLVLVTETIEAHDELRRVFLHPQIAPENKKALIDQVFKNDLNKDVLNLIKLLVDKQRENIISDLKTEYIAMANAERGVVEMTVTTAQPLDDEETAELKQKLSQAFHKKLRIHTKVDPDVIGGLLVRVGNRLFDGTVAGKLQRFEQELKVGN